MTFSGVSLVESVNTAIEHALDHAGTQESPAACTAKDIGSAAVLISLLLAGTVWGLVVLFQRSPVLGLIPLRI